MGYNAKLVYPLQGFKKLINNQGAYVEEIKKGVLKLEHEKSGKYILIFKNGTWGTEKT